MRRKRRTRSITRGITRSLVNPLSSGIAGVFGRGLSGLLSLYPGAAAGYSLRKIGSGPVVRLRRGIDNEEKDFAAGDLIDGGFLSDELCSDPDFLDSGEWTVGTGWTFGSGNASLVSVNGSNCFLTNIALAGLSLDGTNGRYFKITFTIDSMSDNTAVGMAVGTSTYREFDEFQITSTGTYTVIYDYEARGTPFSILCRFFATSSAPNGSTLQVSQLSVREYQPSAAEQWALEGLTSILTYSRQDDESAYATTWYDQSGSGNDATQSTAASQPLLILAGVTNTENGKAALSFDGVDDGLIFSGPISSSASDYFGTFVGAVSDGGYVIYGTPNTVVLGLNTESGFWGGSAYGGDTWKSSTQQLSTWSLVATDQAATFINGVDDLSGLTYSQQDWGTVANQCSIMFRFNDANHCTGNLQEVILYPSDQSSNRTGIEGNINDHYGIY